MLMIWFMGLMRIDLVGICVRSLAVDLDMLRGRLQMLVADWVEIGLPLVGAVLGGLLSCLVLCRIRYRKFGICLNMMKSFPVHVSCVHTLRRVSYKEEIEVPFSRPVVEAIQHGSFKVRWLP